MLNTYDPLSLLGVTGVGFVFYLVFRVLDVCEKRRSE
jgi:hypothetical protein